jgi:cytochrome c oxidase subunit IV
VKWIEEEQALENGQINEVCYKVTVWIVVLVHSNISYITDIFLCFRNLLRW